MHIPTHDDVNAAHRRIAPHVHRTPVLTSASLDRLTGAGLFFKCENFQRAGAFKARGASNAVFGLSDSEAANGVATHSSGNHAQALAWAARRRGIPCHVVMPDDAVAAKKEAVIGYGGRIVECAPSHPARKAALAALLGETGAAFVHPYDDPRVIAGQATCAVEMMEQTDGLDAVIAPIGGGGMVSGICLALSAIAPDTQVYAAEPEQADDAARSLRAGRIVVDEAPETIADGLKAPLGELTWHFVWGGVTDILTISEREIVAAMKLMWTRLKTVVEPSSAVPLAAILKHPRVFVGKRVGVVVTGGNVDPDRLPWMAG